MKEAVGWRGRCSVQVVEDGVGGEWWWVSDMQMGEGLE